MNALKFCSSLSYLLFGLLLLVSLPNLTSAQKTETSAENDRVKKPEELREGKRLEPVWQQDDHIHFTPDRAFSRFEEMDENDNRRVTFSEVKRSKYSLTEREFKRLDTDASGYLDREEYVGIAPDPGNDYREREGLQ